MDTYTRICIRLYINTLVLCKIRSDDLRSLRFDWLGLIGRPVSGTTSGLRLLGLYSPFVLWTWRSRVQSLPCVGLLGEFHNSDPFLSSLSLSLSPSVRRRRRRRRRKQWQLLRSTSYPVSWSFPSHCGCSSCNSILSLSPPLLLHARIMHYVYLHSQLALYMYTHLCIVLCMCLCKTALLAS